MRRDGPPSSRLRVRTSGSQPKPQPPPQFPLQPNAVANPSSTEASSSSSNGCAAANAHLYPSVIRLGEDQNPPPQPPTSNPTGERNYEIGVRLGKGSFGVVTQATDKTNNRAVAIKWVLQDPRYKNRELDIMRGLRHPNIVSLVDFYFTSEPSTSASGPSRYLSVVMDFMPDTVAHVLKCLTKRGGAMPLINVKLFTFQLCRAAGYIHAKGICHRDIKPQNLLVDPETNVLKLCDFGSAKKLAAGERSVSYICSRYYRAPELMLGATIYTVAIDIWSIGCVMAELILGEPLFSGANSLEQLVKIIEILGVPTNRQLEAMSPHHAEFHFPDVRSKGIPQKFAKVAGSDAVNLLSLFLQYDPQARIKPYQALVHPFFEDLLDPTIMTSPPPPDLLSFSDWELQAMDPATQSRILDHRRRWLEAHANAPECGLLNQLEPH